MSEPERQKVGNLDIEAIKSARDAGELTTPNIDDMIIEIVWLRELRDLFNNYTRDLTFAGPHKNIRELLYTRRDLKACREFIESIASGRFRPTMEDARYFLAGVDAETKKGA